MTTRATVTDVYTDGYVEIALWENGAPGSQRAIAEIHYKKPRRGDVIDVEPTQPRDDRIARVAYIGPVLFFVLGILLMKNSAWPERLLTGAILFAMTFVMAWLMNRPARLRRRMAWRSTRVIKKQELL